MSDIKVGDRVELLASDGAAIGYSGIVTGRDGVSTRLTCDDGVKMTWASGFVRVIAPAPAVASPSTGDLLHQSGARVMAGDIIIVPTLETATGDDLDRLARDRLGALRNGSETDRDFRDRCLNYIDAPDPHVTHAEWAAAIAQINDQAKALDTVRKFLGSHSFASCSLAAQRELREVMGVVLAAIDKEKAGK